MYRHWSILSIPQEIASMANLPMTTLLPRPWCMIAKCLYAVTLPFWSSLYHEDAMPLES